MTALQIGADEQGRLAMDQLLSTIDGHTAQGMTRIDARLVVRASTQRTR